MELSQSEALNVQLENDGDLVARSGRPGGELLGAFSSRVFDRGKHCLWGNEGLDNGKVTRVGAMGAPTAEIAIKLWRVLSESLYGEQSVKGVDGQGHPRMLPAFDPGKSLNFGHVEAYVG